MKRLLLIFCLCSCLAMVSSCRQNNLQSLPVKSNQNADLKFDTSFIAVLQDTSSLYWVDKNAKAVSLNNQDLFIIDSLLKEAVDSYDKKLVTWIDSAYMNKSDKIEQENFFLINLKSYKRQYVPYMDESGQIVVWVNCFCSTHHDYWKTEVVFVHDGGNCYFNLTINLTSKEYTNFRVNGYA